MENNFHPDLPPADFFPPAISLQGGDEHTFQVALQIAELSSGDYDAGLSLFREWNKTCQPPWDDYRIVYKFNEAWDWIYGVEGAEQIWTPERDIQRVKKSKVSFKRLNEVAFQSKGRFAQFLEAKKPLVPPLEEVIDHMYPGNPWLCRAIRWQGWAYTDRRESIRGIEHKFEWLVPSPMSKQTGTTRKGKEGSHRCLDNAGERRYIVIEFDFTKIFQPHIDAWAAEGISTRDVQAELILQLATEGEVRQWPFLVVDSGGKSLHSWYSINAGFSEEEALELLARAIPYGADPRADEPERFFRFPGGTRESERSQKQSILLFDRQKI